MDFEAYRDDFPIFETKSYLNTCSLGPLSTWSRDAAHRFFDDWDDLGAHAWYERWMEALDRARGQFASLIGATRDEIALAPNVSSALSIIASALDYGERSEVLSTDLDFPTLPYQWQVNPHAELRLLRSPDTITFPAQDWEASVTDRTLAVATCHVFFATGFLQDIPALGDLARERGAITIVDGYHATGQLPVDVRELGVDVYISGSLKWLLGGPGLAFLYVRRDRIAEWSPTFTGWFANAHQFDFDPQAFTFRDDARRFEVGTPATAVAFSALAGLDLIQEVGPSQIRDRTLALANDLIERAEDAKLDVRAPPPEARTGIVMVEVLDPEDTVQRLLGRNIIVDSRGSRVRISPYFYNTFEENEAVVDVLSAAG
ncbi:MAG: aminotransferase class V-fold PLP-dependent enzyme [Thermoplasmata archaeon]